MHSQQRGLKNPRLGQSGLKSTLQEDFPFNITYEEITDKLEIGHGRFGIVYK